MKNIVKITIIFATMLVGLGVVLAQRPTATPQPTPITLAFQPNPGELHEVITQLIETETDPQTKLSLGWGLFYIPTAVGQTITIWKINSLWRVLDRDQQGNSVIEITYKRVQSARTFGRMVNTWANFLVNDKGYVVAWDTEQKTTDINPGFAGLEQMPKNEKVEFFVRYLRDIELVRQALGKYFVDHPFRIVVDKRGRIIDVQDMDLLLDQYRTELAKLEPDFETRARYDAVVNAFLGEDAVRESLTVYQLLPFPATPVTLGQKWSDTYEFKALGMKVPVTREFSVIQSNPYPVYYHLLGNANYSVALGSGESELGLVGSTEISTSVDAKTGMFEVLKQKGNIKLRQQPAPDSLPVPQNDFAMRFDQTTRFSRIATRSVSDRSKWRFYGGHESFFILLGETWYRRELEASGPSLSVFIDSRGGGWIKSQMVAKGYPTTMAKGYRMVLHRKEDIPAYLEEYSKLSFPIKTSTFKMLKTFRTANVDWYRARVDITYEIGFVDHLIVQGGFDGETFFVFLVSGLGDDFERQLAEGTTALDSIEITSR